MFYTEEDCNLLLKTIERKQLERSIYNSIESLPIAVGSAMDCQMDLDIQRCRAM